MTDLSPAAQAVLADYSAAADFTFDPEHDYWRVKAGLAAALRALADQVVPQPRLPYDSCCDVHAAAIRSEILAIAAELKGE